MKDIEQIIKEVSGTMAMKGIHRYGIMGKNYDYSYEWDIKLIFQIYLR